MTQSEYRKIYEFLGKSIVKYGTFGVNLGFKATKTLVDGKMKYTGHADRKEICVAIGGADLDHWFSVFIHETCHLDQALENPALFSAATSNLDKLDRWLAKKCEYSDQKLDRIFESIIRLEHDCESRTIQKIKQERLPIKVSTYSASANKYILDYHQVRKYRTWNDIPDRKEMYNKLPKRLITLERALNP
jgi:hypothetical protein